MGLRRKSRELALQFLFSLEFQDRLTASTEELTEAWEQFCQYFEIDPKKSTREKVVPYAKYLVDGILGSLATLDAALSQASHNWRLERMPLVDRNILRIAIFEMNQGGDVPVQVAINEALEVSRRYTVGESVSFINGILDAVYAQDTGNQS